MARTEDVEGKYKRGANRTKEQREFPSYITKDLTQLFLEKYLTFFRELANTYTIENRVSLEIWQAIYDCVKDLTSVFINEEDTMFTMDRLNGLKYFKDPSRIYMVRERERMTVIPDLLQQYDDANQSEAKTEIQKWHKENEIAAALYRIYMHMYLYLTETKK